MATKPTSRPDDEPAEGETEKVTRPPGRYDALAAFLGEEGLGDYIAAGGHVTDPILRRLYGID